MYAVALDQVYFQMSSGIVNAGPSQAALLAGATSLALRRTFAECVSTEGGCGYGRYDLGILEY